MIQSFKASKLTFSVFLIFIAFWLYFRPPRHYLMSFFESQFLTQMTVLTVTCLLKLSTQWVKYELGCVYIDLPIGEMKKINK